MKKEPLGLYLLRVATGFAILAFLIMLYWSSLLVEERLREINFEISNLRSAIVSLRMESGSREGAKEGGEYKAKDGNGLRRDTMDFSYPNLMTVDPFYAETLPRLLGPDFKPVGVFHDATIGKPDNLHPFNNWSHISTWRGMCEVTGARMKFGKYETFAPNMAIRVEERKREDTGAPEYWVFLRDNVYWQPLNERMFAGKVALAPQFFEKHQVTANDYKLFFDAVMNPYVQKPGAVALRTYIGDIEEIKVVDDLTFVVRWATRDVKQEDGTVIPKVKYVAKMWTGALSPLPGFVYKYFADGTKIIEDDSDPETYRTNSVWAQNFSEHWAKNIIVSCGAWIFEEMTDRQIRFRRNPDHFNPYDALGSKSYFDFKNSPDSIWQEFKTGSIDTYNLRPDQIIELENFMSSELYQQQAKQGNAIKRLDFDARNYSYIGWNMAKPYFKSRKVRQAMTMAIDRDRIINQYLNGLGSKLTGPFSPHSSSYDKSVKAFPYDPQMSRLLLEEEGWYDSDGDGVVDKTINGKRVPFEFYLTYYVKNPTTKAICEYVATALKEIGVKCLLKGVDLADLSAAFDDKGFDALCLGWALGTPPEDPRQLWDSAGAKEPGSSNAVGFAYPEADAIIDQLGYEDNPEKRTQLYHRFHRIIHEEQPYTFLYTPKTVLLYREYVKNVFIPADRQDLIPGADMSEPSSTIFWIDK